MCKALDRSWELARDVAIRMHAELGITEAQGNCVIHWTGKCWQVGVRRLSDGKLLLRAVEASPRGQEAIHAN